MSVFDPQHPQPHRRYAATDYSLAAIQARDAWRHDRTCFACGREIMPGPICLVEIENHERKMHPPCLSAYERLIAFHEQQAHHATDLGVKPLLKAKHWQDLPDTDRYMLIRTLLDLSAGA